MEEKFINMLLADILKDFQLEQYCKNYNIYIKFEIIMLAEDAEFFFKLLKI